MATCRILLVRLDGIGDALVCTPLIAALRAAGHLVGIALSDRNAATFAPGTAVATHVLERIPWPRHGSTPASRERAQAEIATMRYDVALVASEEPEAYELAAPIARRTGFVTSWAKPFKAYWARRRLTRCVTRAATVRGDGAHEVEIIYRLGGDLVVGPPSRDATVLRPLIAGVRPLPVRTGIVVQLGAKWRAAGVSDAAFRRMASALRARGARFILPAGERYPIEDATFVTPPTTRAWIDAIDDAAVLVSPDTGAAHVAGMLGVPVVDVFPDAHFEAQARRWRPWAASSIVVRAGELERAPETLIVQALDGV